MSQDLREIKKQLQTLQDAISKASGEYSATTFGEFGKRYTEQKLGSTGIRESTKRAFEYQMRRNLIPEFDKIPIDQLSNSHWNDWVSKMRIANELAGQKGEQKQITRFFNARKCLTETMHAARKEGLIDRTPEFDNPDERKDVGRVLTQTEFCKILWKTTYRIFRIFFWVLWKQGCRPREVLQWEWSFFEWDEPGHTWLNVPARISKTGRNRKIALNRRVSALLWRQWRKKPSSRYVFPNRIHPNRPQLSYHGAWKTALTKAGLTAHAVPYDTRRTFITEAVASNKPTVFIGKQLDTSSKQIEGTYAKKDKSTMEDIVN